jgi:predicted permease
MGNEEITKEDNLKEENIKKDENGLKIILWLFVPNLIIQIWLYGGFSAYVLGAILVVFLITAGVYYFIGFIARRVFKRKCPIVLQMALAYAIYYLPHQMAEMGG